MALCVGDGLGRDSETGRLVVRLCGDCNGGSFDALTPTIDVDAAVTDLLDQWLASVETDRAAMDTRVNDPAKAALFYGPDEALSNPPSELLAHVETTIDSVIEAADDSLGLKIKKPKKDKKDKK